MAISSPTSGDAYSLGVRNALIGKGVSAGDIGYDPSKGVTVKGQTFINPDKVYQGSAYTSSNNFNKAWDAYQSTLNNPAPSSTANTGYTASVQPTANPYAAYNPYSNAGAQNPYNNQIADVIKAIQVMASGNQSYDPYSSPEYAAQQAQQQRAADQSIRAAQETMGSAGFGRSTALGDAAQTAQNTANEYMQLQVVPQLIAANQARQQQQFQNTLAALDPLLNQQSRADNLVQQGFNNSIAQGQLTGNYVPQGANEIINQLLNLKTQAEAKGITADQRTGLSQQADVLRNQLASLGYNPTQFGSNVTASQASQNVGQGMRTLGGQEMDENVRQYNQNYAYQQARDAIKDKQYQQTFDENVREHDLAYALQKAQLAHQISNDAAQLAISQMNAQTSRMNVTNDNARAASTANFNQLMDVWKASGKAPAGLEKFGITQGTSFGSGSNNGMSEELSGLYSGLTSGKLSADQALSEINGRERMGFTTKEDAANMRAFVQQYLEGGSGQSTPKPQQPAKTTVGKSATELLKDWETDPTGKSAGRAKYDWVQWMTSPQGYSAGTSYEVWKDKYGPRLGG
ncbi:hypothetical protein [Cohnella nanjingensis]|uniref:Uncharacterized protein n=1 Tax=Cohnella nanjingensis TaxID=1387779 RepID=A0A7X0RUC2_9BACL|nr:hypothetical protein [Cohnella nanjingensis]MBB6672631.1 hypothetical protein [Cohnella nanjingensis]